MPQSLPWVGVAGRCWPLQRGPHTPGREADAAWIRCRAGKPQQAPANLSSRPQMSASFAPAAWPGWAAGGSWSSYLLRCHPSGRPWCGGRDPAPAPRARRHRPNPSPPPTPNYCYFQDTGCTLVSVFDQRTPSSALSPGPTNRNSSTRIRMRVRWFGMVGAGVGRPR